MGEPNEDGFREVFFQMNGQTRNVLVKDNSVKSLKVTNAKASGPNDIGAPLQGSLLKILVAEGDKIEKDTPLFIIEAMKMETIICAPRAGIISKVVLKEKSMIEQDDCVIEIQ